MGQGYAGMVAVALGPTGFCQRSSRKGVGTEVTTLLASLVPKGLRSSKPFSFSTCSPEICWHVDLPVCEGGPCGLQGMGCGCSLGVIRMHRGVSCKRPVSSF